MSSIDTDIISPQTAEQMVNAYQEAGKMIEQGYTLLAQAQNLLNATFGDGHYSAVDVIDSHAHYYGFHAKPQEIISETMKRVLKKAWRVIIGKLEIHKVASNKRWDKIQEDIEKGTLPELTTAAIYDLLVSFQQNANEIQAELVKEVYEILRPGSYYNKEYKTNSPYEIGKRVILPYMIRPGYGKSRFQVAYQKDQKIRAIDRVFHMLDGKGIPDGYNTPLFDAINTSLDGKGETDYFKFSAHQNGNLHLEFKRADLVNSLNAIAGGARLRDDKPKTRYGTKTAHQQGFTF